MPGPWKRRVLARPHPIYDGKLEQVERSAVGEAGGPIHSLCEIRHSDTGRVRLVVRVGGRGRGAGPVEDEVIDVATGERLRIPSTDPEWMARKVDVDELPAALLADWPRDRAGRPIRPGWQPSGSDPVPLATILQLGRAAGAALEPAQGALFG